jgi:DNA-binding MarR family transcriptional regulator
MNSRKDRGKHTAPHRHFSYGVRLIERTLRSDGEPVIGLHLYMAFGWLARSMARGSRFAAIKPGTIGVPTLLKAHPGLSQTELADLLGIERATVGMQVERCIRDGLVQRRRCTEDRRRYRLYIAPKGQTYLRRIATLIPQHEKHLFGRLTGAERTGLYNLLRKLIDDASHHGSRKMKQLPQVK